MRLEPFLEQSLKRLQGEKDHQSLWFEWRCEQVRSGTGGIQPKNTKKLLFGGVLSNERYVFAGSWDHWAPWDQPILKVAGPPEIPKPTFSAPWEIPANWPMDTRLFERHAVQQVWYIDRDGIKTEKREGCHQRLQTPLGVQDRTIHPGKHPKPWSPPINQPKRALETVAPTVVYAPGVVGIVVHELVGHASEGSSGLPLGDSQVPIRVLEDPRRGRVPWTFDDEGVEVRPSQLTDERGLICGLHSRVSAAKFDANAKANGSARRSTFRDPVHPRMGCTYLERGESSPESVLDSVQEGVYIERLEAGWFDPTKLQSWMLVTQAREIKNGKLGEPLLPFRITMTLKEWWKHVEAVADDLEFDRVVGSCYRHGQPLPVSVGGPTCRQRLVTVIP